MKTLKRLLKGVLHGLATPPAGVTAHQVTVEQHLGSLERDIIALEHRVNATDYRAQQTLACPKPPGRR